MKGFNLTIEDVNFPLSNDKVCCELNVLMKILRIVILKPELKRPELKRVKLSLVNGTEKRLFPEG
jgi:hypothetical protein